MTTEEHASEREEDLDRWAAARVGDDLRLIEALRQLVSSYRTLEELGENSLPCSRSPTTPAGLHTRRRAVSSQAVAAGGGIHKRLRAPDGQTGLKFHTLDRRRRKLQKENDEYS